RAEGLPEEVWKAIYFQYLPVGVEADAPPTRAQLGKGALTWAAVSLADKLDTIVGLFAAGERPTGSRDPYALRRAAQGVMKILVAQPDLFAADMAVGIEQMIDEAFANYAGALSSDGSWKNGLFEFLAEREAYLFERRGFHVGETRAVAHFWGRPHSARRRLEA